MVYTMLLGLALALPASPARRPHDGGPVGPDTLTCTVTAGPKAKRRCSVMIPERRAILACSAADRRADRCTTHGGGAHAVWVTGAGGARCKVSSKRSDWKTKVTLSMNKKSMKTRGAACALHVAVR
ncbi:MAG: hypothetical protein ABR499_13905 [Gemmatimonadaceae bacterium]